MPVNLDDYDPDAPVKQQAVGNALGALDVEPEAYSRNAALAKRLALPAPVVEMDPTGFARQDKTQETLKWLDETPPLARYVAKNPNAAKVSSDDYRQLSEISRTLGGLPGMERQGSEETPAPVVLGEVPDWQRKFMTGFQRGTLSEQRGKIGRKMLAIGDTPEDWRAVTTLDKQLQGLTDDNSWSQWSGQLFAGLSSGGNDALLGFGAGAAAGAVGGPVGAGAGAMTGAMMGWLGSQAATAAGNSYLNLKQAGVDPVPARIGSLAVGVINYMANRVMMDSASRGVVDTLVQSGLKEVLKQPVVSAAVTKGLVELGKVGTTGAALFAGQEAATAIVEDLTKTYQGNLPTLFNDPAAHAQALDRVKHAMLNGFAMMTVMHVPKVGVNMVADSIYMKQANLYHQMVKDAIDQSVLSETYRRDPDLFRQFITENSEQQIGIHSDIINQLGADKFEWIPDLAPQLEKAKATGADVTVSLPTLLAHGSEFMKENPEVLDHVRVGEGLTKAEADWLKANPPEYDKPELNVISPPAHDLNYAREQLDVTNKALAAEEITPELRADLDKERVRLEKYIQEQTLKQRPPEVPAVITKSPEAAAKFSETTELAARAIAAEVKANWLYGLFEGQKALGMTGKEYLTYLRLLDKKNKALYDKASAKAEAEAKKLLSPEYKARFDGIRAEVAEEMNRDPVHLADRLIRLGKMEDGEKVEGGFPYKLSRDDVENMFRHFQPDSALSEFAQQLGVKAPVPDDLPGSMYGKNSMHPDDIAALTGFDSGRDMVLALVNLETRRREAGLDPARYFDSQVKAEATRRIEAERGTLEERIQEWAEDAVKSGPQMEVLANEMKVLAREAGHQGPITREMIESQLAKITEETPIGQTRKAALWERRAGEYGKQAELGMNAGDPQRAFLAKQSQFVNFLMARQAKELDRAFEQLQGTFKRLRDNLTLSGVDQAYVDQLHLVMATVFDEKLYRDPAELLRSLKGVTFEKFVDNLRQDGKQIDPPEFLTSHDPTTGGVKADLLPTGDFLALKDFFDQMLFYGRQEHKLTMKDNQIEFADAVGQAKLQTSELKQRGFEPAGKLTSIFRTADAALLRMERLFDWLDQRSPDGIFNRVVFRPLADAQGRKQTMLAEIAKDIGALPKFRGSDAVSGGTQFRDSRGRPIVWDKGKVITAALNMGNESNWQKLTRGYSWDPDTFRAFVMDNMTKENWQFVQGVWDSFEKLFPQADEVSRRTNGVGLKKVEAAPVQTQYGEFRGGYYPLIEDEGNLLRKDKKDLRFDGPGFAPMLTRGYEKWRTNAIYPLSLDIDMLTAKFNEEVHNIAFREAWMNAKKFLDNSTVRTSIEDAFGKEYLGMVDPWIEHIRASGGGPDRSGLAGIKDWLRFGRENMVTAMIGLKPGTAVIHGLGALSNSVREVGGLDFYRATVDSIFKSPQGYDSVRQAILDKSEMMANRKHNIDRDAAAAINAININNRFGQWRASYAQFATGLVSALDMGSAIPTWWAAYNKHLAEHGDEAGAIYAADKATRNAHGGNGLIDLPALLRGTNTTQGELMKFTTAFGGYFNHVYNQMRDVHVAATDPTMKAGFGKFMYVAGGLLGYLVVPALLHEAVRPPKEGFDPDHMPKEMAWALANQSMAMVPYVRDVGAMFQLGKDKVEAGGPLGELLSGLTAPGGDLRRWLNDKEPRHVAQHMLELPTWATGLGPPRYVASQLEYLYKLNDGSTRLPETYLEWHRLLLDARPVGK